MSALENGCRPPTCANDSDHMTSCAAAIASVYWPALKRIRHHGLPAWRSWITDAAAWAISAGARPPASSSASANEPESVISSSLPRRGILIGIISPSRTPTASTPKLTG